jgi:acetylglutamate kinase
MLEKFAITPKVIDGRRVTDSETLKVVQMVYAGLLNKNIVVRLQSLGCNAIGLTGADANCILARKREVGEIDYGYAGDIENVNSIILSQLLSLNLVPVLCALTHNGHSQMLNTNADTIAAEVGGAMSKHYQVNLIYCFDKSGVLQQEGDENSLMKNITKEIFEALVRQKKISKGMIPKLHTAFKALDAGINSAHIIHFAALKDIATGTFTGTRITK